MSHGRARASSQQREQSTRRNGRSARARTRTGSSITERMQGSARSGSTSPSHMPSCSAVAMSTPRPLHNGELDDPCKMTYSRMAFSSRPCGLLRRKHAQMWHTPARQLSAHEHESAAAATGSTHARGRSTSGGRRRRRCRSPAGCRRPSRRGSSPVGCGQQTSVERIHSRRKIKRRSWRSRSRTRTR